MNALQDPPGNRDSHATHYVDFCSRVLETAIDFIDSDSMIAAQGVTYVDIAKAVFPELPDEQARRKTGIAVQFAGADLAAEGLLVALLSKKSGKPNNVYRLAQAGRVAAIDPTNLWETICNRGVNPAHVEVLRAINSASIKPVGGWSIAEQIFTPAVLDALGWTTDDDARRAVSIARELAEQGLVLFDGGGKTMVVRSTYAGVIWDTRRKHTIDARELSRLVAHGETTSIELKRMVNTATKDEKAEFVKDILGLANTQASPPHVLIIGFDDKTLEYVGPPNPAMNQDHLEQVLSAYASPVPSIRYREIATPSGPVGRIEVLRDATQLPYRVRTSVGDKKRIVDSDVFVRHGSQTVRASDEEIQALVEEAEWARSRAGLDASARTALSASQSEK